VATENYTSDVNPDVTVTGLPKGFEKAESGRAENVYYDNESTESIRIHPKDGKGLSGKVVINMLSDNPMILGPGDEYPIPGTDPEVKVIIRK
jgi:hypothetical protein